MASGTRSLSHFRAWTIARAGQIRILFQERIGPEISGAQDLVNFTHSDSLLVSRFFFPLSSVSSSIAVEHTASIPRVTSVYSYCPEAAMCPGLLTNEPWEILKSPWVLQGASSRVP